MQKKFVEYITEPFPDSDLAGFISPGWYFWDGYQPPFCNGPFNSFEEALENWDLYCGAAVCWNGYLLDQKRRA